MKPIAALVVLLSSAAWLGNSAVEQTPLFHPDHLGCALAPAVLEAMAESRFIADTFAHAGTGGARDREVEWSGFYVYGRLTYLEFFLAEGFVVPVETGDCMIALNAETPGSAGWLVDTMRAALPASRPSRLERRVNLGGRELDWFTAAVFDWEDRLGMGLWALEYDPEFKHTAAPTLYPEPGDITRERKAPPVAHHPDKLLGDVIALELALDATRIETLATQLEIMGYRSSATARRSGRSHPT